jgi:hypothetical protein
MRRKNWLAIRVISNLKYGRRARKSIILLRMEIQMYTRSSTMVYFKNGAGYSKGHFSGLASKSMPTTLNAPTREFT